MKPARAFLVAEWRDLVMLNYAVDSALLLPLVHAGTELDAYRGTTYLSVVGFGFVSTRVLGFSVPGHRDFEEVNLRFYVRRRAADGWRRGVVFIRELVPRQLIAWIARAWYNEPYRALPMRHTITRAPDGTPSEVSYEWRLGGAWEGLSIQTVGPTTAVAAGSEAEFITEHFWGYTRQRNGATIEYRVTHPSWSIRAASQAILRSDVASLYGPQFAAVLSGPPASAFWADGSAVVVHRPEIISRTAERTR
jgi:uncharacterized protein YqjF (DUF2071 family)